MELGDSTGGTRQFHRWNAVAHYDVHAEVRLRTSASVSVRWNHKFAPLRKKIQVYLKKSGTFSYICTQYETF